MSNADILKSLISDYLNRDKTQNKLTHKQYLSKIKAISKCDQQKLIKDIVCKQLISIDSSIEETITMIIDTLSLQMKKANQEVKLGVFNGFESFLYDKLKVLPDNQKIQIKFKALQCLGCMDTDILDQFIRFFYTEEFKKENLSKIITQTTEYLKAVDPKLFIRGLRMVSGFRLHNQLNDFQLISLIQNYHHLDISLYRFYFDHNPESINRIFMLYESSNQSKQYDKLAVSLCKLYKQHPLINIKNFSSYQNMIWKLSKKAYYYYFRKFPFELVENKYSNHINVLKIYSNYLLRHHKYVEAYSLNKRYNLGVDFIEQFPIIPNILIQNDAFGPTQSAVLGHKQNYLTLQQFDIMQKDMNFIHDIRSLASYQNDVFQSKIIGFDCESSGGANAIDNNVLETIQIATQSKVFIFDVPALNRELQFKNFIQKLFFSQNSQLLVGFNMKSDRKLLNSIIKSSKPLKNHIDLETQMKQSVAKLALKHFKKPMSKYQQMSNWSMRPLRKAQLHYSGLDAFMMIKLFYKRGL